MKHVAIVGLSPATHGKAPWFTANSDNTEIWGLPWDTGYWQRCNRLFEMHDMKLLINVSHRPAGYVERLSEIEVPLYMQEKYLTNSTRYPFEEVAASTTDYWNSSIGYMLALAIHEQFERISIFGVDMRGDDEYGYQKPNCEYLVGLARGRGIEVVIPDESPLCKFSPHGIKYGKEVQTYRGRYGRL